MRKLAPKDFAAVKAAVWVLSTVSWPPKAW